MTINSRSKGKRGELEAARALETHIGGEWRRTQQFKGTPQSADVESDQFPAIHVEVKRTERFNCTEVVMRAASEAGIKIPLTLHKKNRGEWIACLPLVDLVRLAAYLNERRGTE